MKPVLVWELPTRLFQWLLAAGCLAAFGLALALAAPEHSRAYDLHMLCGLFLLPLINTAIQLGKIGHHHGVQHEYDDD